MPPKMVPLNDKMISFIFNLVSISDFLTSVWTLNESLQFCANFPLHLFLYSVWISSLSSGLFFGWIFTLLNKNQDSIYHQIVRSNQENYSVVKRGNVLKHRVTNVPENFFPFPSLLFKTEKKRRHSAYCLGYWSHIQNMM